MKKLGMALMAGLLCLALAACGGGEKAPFDPEETTRALLDTPGVFSETLERLDRTVLDGLYGLDDDGAEAVGYYSPGGTAEEVTVFRFADQAAAAAFVRTAQEHIADQKEANETYRPQEMPKLEKARVEQRGATLLVLVAADYDAADGALK